MRSAFSTAFLALPLLLACGCEHRVERVVLRLGPADFLGGPAPRHEPVVQIGDEARAVLVPPATMSVVDVKVKRPADGIRGVGEATKAEPHRNLMFAPWWTDGRRAIIQLADESERIPIDEFEFFGCFRFGERIRGARGMTLKGRAGPGGEPVVEDDAGADTD